MVALARLADWCGRYTPWTAIDHADEGGGAGLFLDITGCAHLFGGEAALLRDLTRRLAAFGLAVRAAVADTPGAAWAWARFGADRIVPPGAQREHLAPLPVASLRLGAAVVEMLNGLGLRRIGDLYKLPRSALAARFGNTTLRRLDQALGIEYEPLTPRRPPAPHRVVMNFAEPIATAESIAATARTLLADLCDGLAAQDMGARRLELMIYRADGTVAGLAVGTRQPTRDPVHLFRLFREVLDKVDPGFGIDTVALSARAVEALRAQQHSLGTTGGDGAVPATDLAELFDVLGMRLGYAHVMRLAARPSHVPERAVARVSPTEPSDARIWPLDWERPLRLLSRPEPVEVLAPVPDGPPRQFVWRGVTHRIAHAQGPERIAGEWWRDDAALRDYYQVEDMDGRRFWVFREGLYAATGARWFLHGLFA